MHKLQATKSVQAIMMNIITKGHEFLANIRNDSFYNKVKDIGTELGVQSLKDLTQIALSAASLVIKSHFNLP